jgi:hypothetical protein
MKRRPDRSEWPHRLEGRSRLGWLQALLPLALLLVGLALPPAPDPLLPGLKPAWAGPVDWREVPASATGRQWWDAGSLRRDRRGTLSVLSRFQPLSEPEAMQAPQSQPTPTAGSSGAKPRSSRQPLGTLVVMELDCDLRLYRDVSVNGLPRFNATWQPTGGDPLVAATLLEACAAAAGPAIVREPTA